MIEVCSKYDSLGFALMKTMQAKDKEQAVLYLHRMYDLQPVIHGKISLRIKTVKC
jgi:hypothetical protein